MDFPYLFNLPIYQTLDNQKELPLSFNNCDEWYLYDFDNDTPEEDKAFFGFNEGEIPEEAMEKIKEIYTLEEYNKLAENAKKNTDLNKELLSLLVSKSLSEPSSGLEKDTSLNSTKNNFFYSVKSKPYRAYSSGILSSQTNIIQSACDKTLKMSPYFKKTIFNGENRVNNDIYYRLKALNQIDYDLLKQEIGINVLPDGAVTIKKANPKAFEYKIQINDNRFPFYHKTNGVTKYLLYNSGAKRYSGFMSITNGALWLIDLLNRAYMKYIHPELYVVSGIQLMPFKLNNADNVARLINVAGSTFYPLAISLLMPLFMYTIVLEKESKLVEIMKINGMKMTYYWTSLFVFNYAIYTVTFILFYIFGIWVYAFGLFYQTSYILQLLIFVGWGLCQNGLAFFFQAFLSNARTSTSKFYYKKYIF